jgi:hypothetical protein
MKKKKNNDRAEAKEEGDKRCRTQEGKNGGRGEGKHRTKAREHQVNCLAQRIEDKERREGMCVHSTRQPCFCILSR